MEIPGGVEPSVGHVVRDFDHEGLPFPPPAGMTHPRIARMLEVRSIHVDHARRARKFVGDQDVVGRLHDLEREGHVRGARDTRHVALDDGVESQPVLAVRVALRERLVPVRDLAALHNREPARDRPERTHFHDRAGLGGMTFDVPVGGAESLPDSVQVGVAVRGERCLVVLCPSRAGDQCESKYDDQRIGPDGDRHRVQAMTHRERLHQESTTIAGRTGTDRIGKSPNDRVASRFGDHETLGFKAAICE